MVESGERSGEEWGGREGIRYMKQPWCSSAKPWPDEETRRSDEMRFAVGCRRALRSNLARCASSFPARLLSIRLGYQCAVQSGAPMSQRHHSQPSPKTNIDGAGRRSGRGNPTRAGGQADGQTVWHVGPTGPEAVDWTACHGTGAASSTPWRAGGGRQCGSWDGGQARRCDGQLADATEAAMERRRLSWGIDGGQPGGG